jgi:uncharacterized membrane protein HdeD (DUF308 family)
VVPVAVVGALDIVTGYIALVHAAARRWPPWQLLAAATLSGVAVVVAPWAYLAAAGVISAVALWREPPS